MPLFITDEELQRLSHDGAAVAERADIAIREMHSQLETVRAQADAASITAEQTCSLLEQKHVSLSSEFAALQSQHSRLASSLEQRLAELAQLQADTHQVHLQSIGKDGDIERLSMEVSELHKSKRQLIELLERKDSEISERNATIKSYLDKIVNLTDSAGSKEARLRDNEAELARARSSCSRLSQEKELIERHNVWLNDELTAKVNSLMELRKTHGEFEADMSAKLVDAEKKLNESSSSLKWKDARVKELESKLSSLQEELCASKDVAAATEERFAAEISTVTKLVELYKESSEEWSKKAGELEGVVKALETHSNQVENEYKERLEKEVAARQEFEKEAVSLREKLEKCEGELESIRNANEVNLLPFSFSAAKPWTESIEENEMAEANHSLVPSIPLGVSGTALAASLLRDGWSLAKMYVKYQEAVDAMRHEQLGRKQSQAILERVLYEIEEKAGVILDERVEHERLVEAYSAVNQKLQHSLHEEASLERTIQEQKADLRRHERDYSLAQKEIADLQREITVLLKECRDIQLRCGSTGYDLASDNMTAPFVQLNAFDADDVISESLLTFKDINGLVEQNVQLRSLVRSLSDQIENKEVELKEKFEKELQKHSDEAASKVDAVLARAEEQGQMIESLHTSVAMYKRLYEEEHKHQASYAFPQNTSSEGRNGVMLLLEDSQETGRKAQAQASERLKSLEEDLERLRNEIISLRSQRDKLALEASFAQEKLDRFMRDFDHQRDETNGVIARNVEFSQLIIDYQRKLREGSESAQAAEELSRKLTMEVSILKHEKQMLLNSEKRACDEVRSLSERVYRLQATLDTIQSAEEVREEARATESRKQEDYIKKIEREWAEAKSELLRERDNVRNLTLDRESAMKSAMRQVEEMGKELANGLHALAGAEARAALAEARCSDLEKKIKSLETKVYQKDDASGPSPSSANEAVADLHTAKEEIEKLREEAQVTRDHMLQYKGIAQVNEAALKQMEVAYENFKLEADKVKEKLEAELLSLRERVNELEKECSLKTKEAVSAAAAKEEALASAVSTIASLKEESSVKMSEIMVLETQISTMKSDLEKEHQRWQTAQANYERQVILQSETIQELTKTSQALASLQDDASDLRKLADMLKTENEDLKSKLDTEISVLEKSKIEAEQKYNEIDGQNKILHSRLQALHIKLAEKDRDSGTKLTGSIDQDKVDDAGLQNVVSYLRRSKEIGETEISLLKQEKLRLQSQLESALKAAEMAQASLQAERANSRSFLFTEEEFKSLQLQVREMNLLRESNIQLREENKHNFDECQKLHEVAQKARIRTENLETLLGEREAEVDACKREIEMQKIEREHLGKRVDELLERCKNIDVEDYNRMSAEVQQLQVNARETDAQLDELKKLVSEKEDVISQLEQDLARCRVELKERETRINSLLQVEASLKSDIEKQKLIAQLKKRSENLLKEKEEQSKEIQALSKQLEDSRQGKRVVADAAGEADMREKEMEKDTRIQMLEKIVEKVRDDLRKQKDDHKAKRKIVENSYQSTVQDKLKFEDEFKKHKQALQTLSDEVEKLKHAKSSQTEGLSAVQILSGTPLEDFAAAYLLAVQNFDKVVHSLFSESGTSTLADNSSAVDASLGGEVVPPLASSLAPPVAPAPGVPSARVAEDTRKRIISGKPNVETRRFGRKLIRPHITRPEEPPVTDVDMSEMEGPNNAANISSTQNAETQPSVRKRPHVSSTSELQQESIVPRVSSSDAAAPVLKKSKALNSQQEAVELQAAQDPEIPENIPAAEESGDDVGNSPHGLMEEAKDEAEPTGEQAEARQVDGDKSDIGEECLDGPTGLEMADDWPVFQAEQDIQQPVGESGSDHEEGELVPDTVDCEGGEGPTEAGEFVPEQVAAPASPSGVEEEPIPAALDTGEISSIQILDDKTDEVATTEEVAEGTSDQVATETEQDPEAGLGTGGSVPEDISTPGSPVVPEAKQASPVGSSLTSSTTINLSARARQRAALRQAGRVPPLVNRGRAPRGRGRGRGREQG